MNLGRNIRGFTLVEVIVAIGIFGLIVTGIVAIFLTSWRYNAVVWEQLSTQNEGRKVTQDFVNELRTASQSSIGAYPIQTASTSTIIFYTNLDADSLRERVRYFLTNRILKKGVIKPSGNPLTYDPANETITEVAHDVANTSSIFYYFDSNYAGSGTALPTPVDITNIRVVQIALKLEENPNLTPAPLYVESKVLLRNLKSN